MAVSHKGHGGAERSCATVSLLNPCPQNLWAWKMVVCLWFGGGLLVTLDNWNNAVTSILGEVFFGEPIHSFLSIKYVGLKLLVWKFNAFLTWYKFTTIRQSGCAILHTQQLSMRISVALHLCQHLVLFFLMLATLVGMKGYLDVSLFSVLLLLMILSLLSWAY